MLRSTPGSLYGLVAIKDLLSVQKYNFKISAAAPPQ